MAGPQGQEGSGEGKRGRKRTSLALMPLGNPAQLPLDGAGTGEETAVHLIETVVRRPEHEAPRDADGDPDRAAIEFDRKSLRNQDVAPGVQLRLNAVVHPGRRRA